MIIILECRESRTPEIINPIRQSIRVIILGEGMACKCLKRFPCMSGKSLEESIMVV